MDFDIAPTGVLHRTHNARTSWHTSLVHKVIIPLDSTLSIAAGRAEAETRSPLWIPAHCNHRVGSEGRTLTIFIDAVAARQSGLRATENHIQELGGHSWWLGFARELAGGREGSCRADLTRGSARLGSGCAGDAVSAVTAHLRGFWCKEPLDPRVEATIHAIKAAEQHHFQLSQLAAACGLSDSRLRHLFKEQTGTTLRRFALWTRTESAFLSVLLGHSITFAAHEAGFADHAHFTRSLRRLMGQPPSYLTSL